MSPCAKHQRSLIRHSVIFSLVLCLSFFAPGLFAQTPISGSLSGVLTQADSPYLATSGLSVQSGQTLTIEPGVTILFNTSGSLTTYGTLICQGSEGSPVSFTSNQPTPEPGNWYGIFTQSGSVLNFTHTHIEYAGGAGYSGLHTSSGTPAEVYWNGGSVQNCAADGIDILGTTIELRNLLVANNGTDGISLRPGTPPILQDIQSHSNGGTAMRILTNPGSIYSGLSGVGNGINGIEVTGTLGGANDAATFNWYANPNFPVIITALSMNAEDHLIIDPGSVIKFTNTSSSLSIYGGTLETLADPGGAGDTWFTAISDDAHGGDTNGDGPSSGAPASHYGLFLQSGSTTIMRDTYVAYGGNAGYASVTTTSGYAASIDWQGGGLMGSFTDGMRVNSTETRLVDMLISENLGDGFELNSTVPAVLGDLVLNNNGLYGGRLNINPGNLDDTLSGSGNATNGIYVTGQLGGALEGRKWVWDTSENLPIIVNAVTVSGTDTLQFDPGMVAKLASTAASLTVSGSGVLLAPGGENTWLTSLQDDAHGGDTNSDGNTAPFGGQGYGLFLQSGSVALLNDFWLGYAGNAGYAGMTTTSGVSAKLHWNGGGIIGCAGDGARINVTDADLRNLTFAGNGGDGFEFNPYTPPVLDNITANNNGLYGLRINQNPGNLPGNFSGSGNGFNGVYVSGSLGGGGPDEQYSWASGLNFPIIVNAISVAAADSLWIEPGTVLKGNIMSSSLTFNGTLTIPGGAPVWFTSMKDDSHGGDTNNDGNTSTPAPGDWYGIFLQSGSNAHLTDTWVAYGGNAGYANLTTTSGVMNDFSWTRGGSAYSFTDGVRVNAQTFNYERLRMVNNLQDGLDLAAYSSAEVHETDLSGNGLFGLRNRNGSVTINATDNWWGHVSGPYDPTDGNPDYNPDGLGLQVSDNVVYRDWLLETPMNQNPNAFLALMPEAGALFLNEPITFTWTEATDPDGDGLLYTLEVSRTAEFDDIYIARTGLPGTSVTIAGGLLEVDHTSWWRVIARDGYFGETIADPGLRSIIQGQSLVPVPEQTNISFRVGNSWPNPSSMASSVSFRLPSAQKVRLDVFDVRGRLVRNVTNQVFESGNHTVQWDGRGTGGRPAADGMYFYRVQAESGERVRRVMLVR